MLVACPDCERQISERAHACPGCGFPMAEHLAQRAADDARARDRASREHCGEVDCGRCDARGFYTVTDADGSGGGFTWCRVCEHTGRVALVRSHRGYFAVARIHLVAFLAGARDEGDAWVAFLGAETPAPHRYAQAGPRVVEPE